MSGFFLIITTVIALIVIPNVLKSKNTQDHSRMVNADWMTNHDKFHMISRWGA